MRRLMSLLFIVIAIVVFSGENAFAHLWGIFLMVAAAIGIAPDMAGYLSVASGTLFMGHANPLGSDYSRARHAMRRGDLEGALKAFRDYADADHSDQRVRFEIAMIYQQHLLQDDIAHYWFDKVISFRHSNEMEAIAYMESLRILCARGERDKAQRLFLRMSEEFPNHPATQAAKGMFEECSHQVPVAC